MSRGICLLFCSYEDGTMMVWDIRHAAAPLIQARLHDEPGMSESDFMQFLGFVFCILMTLKNQPFKVGHFEHIYMLSMIHGL